MATICGVLVTPALYVAFQRIEDRFKKKKNLPAQPEKHSEH
jgi:hypothetical protein